MNHEALARVIGIRVPIFDQEADADLMRYCLRWLWSAGLTVPVCMVFHGRGRLAGSGSLASDALHAVGNVVQVFGPVFLLAAIFHQFLGGYVLYRNRREQERRLASRLRRDQSPAATSS